MWIQIQSPHGNSECICYRNNALSPKIIKELIFQPSYTFEEDVELVIKFINLDFADQFCEEFTEVCPAYRDDSNELSITAYYYGRNVYEKISNVAAYYSESIADPLSISNIVFILSQQKKYDLIKVCKFLSEKCDVPKEIFPMLLESAKKIVIEKGGRQVNALWELSTACIDLKPPLVEEWCQTLKSIKVDNNYYHKAQTKLAYFMFSKLNELNLHQEDFLDKQKQLLEELIEYASNIPEGNELVEKIALNIIGEDVSKQEQIFPNGVIIGLLSYIKLLQKQHSSLDHKKINNYYSFRNSSVSGLTNFSQANNSDYDSSDDSSSSDNEPPTLKYI